MPRPARPNRSPAEFSSEPERSRGWLFLIGLLLAARYLQPTEAAVFGETLWQAQFWIAGLAGWCWFAWRNGHPVFRLSLLDALLCLLVIGHGLSTIAVFTEGGDRRGALNLTWEWVGLAAAFFLIRQALPWAELRRPLMLFVVMMVPLASLGLWQHHVSLGQTAAEYDTLIADETALAARLTEGTATNEERARLAAIRQELARYGVPTDETARRTLLNRIKFSTEPFATFGLANTLAGLLAAALPMLAVTLWPPQRTPRFAGLLLAFSVVFYCLILTKSRTAFAALAAGGVVAGGLHLLAGRLDRRALLPIAGVVAAALLVGLGVLATGGLDRQVFSEAPKSLKYRLDYWSGTLGVLSERPLLGTGPANFRSYYLEHRPLGASEEIAAPHNLFLDVWTAGGLLSLMALVGLLGYISVQMILDRSENSERGGQLTFGASLEWGALMAFPVVVAVYFASGNGIDWRIIAIAPIAASVMYCLSQVSGDRAGFTASGAGFAALLVHLLGADGMEFPAVVQSLLLFAMVIDRKGEITCCPQKGQWIPALLAGGLAIGCLLTGVVPVLNSAALTARAEAAIQRSDAAADRLLIAAVEADPLAIQPLTLRAELATSRALATRSSTDLKSARDRWRELLDRDPRSIHARQRLAELLLSQAGNGVFDEAAKLLDEAVRLSPTDADLRHRLALALLAAERIEPAAKQALAAIHIDNLNQAAGHYDRVFSPETRSELEEIAAVGKRAPAP